VGRDEETRGGRDRPFITTGGGGLVQLAQLARFYHTPASYWVDGLNDVQRFNLDRAVMMAGLRSLEPEGDAVVKVR
jgi:hypothetical protein